MFSAKVASDRNNPRTGNIRTSYYSAGSTGSFLSPVYVEKVPAGLLLADTAIIQTMRMTPVFSASAMDTTVHPAQSRAGSQLRSLYDDWHPRLWTRCDRRRVNAIAYICRVSDRVLLGVLEAMPLFGTVQLDLIRRRLPQSRRIVVKNDGEAVTGLDGDERGDFAALDAPAGHVGAHAR